MRAVSTLVLPEPAPATISSGEPVCTTASRCCGLSPSSRVSGSTASRTRGRRVASVGTSGAAPNCSAPRSLGTCTPRGRSASSAAGTAALRCPLAVASPALMTTATLLRSADNLPDVGRRGSPDGAQRDRGADQDQPGRADQRGAQPGPERLAGRLDDLADDRP